MRKLIFIPVAAAVIVFFSVTSCKKTTNNTTVVKDSIFYSSWSTLSMKFDNTDSVYYQDFNNSHITASVVRSGAVLGYFGFPGQGDTTAQSASEFDYLGVSQLLAPGVLDLSALSDLSTSKTGALYRYVIIPANVLANTSLKNIPIDQLKKMSFTEIQNATGSAQNTSSGNKPTN